MSVVLTLLITGMIFKTIMLYCDLDMIEVPVADVVLAFAVLCVGWISMVILFVW